MITEELQIYKTAVKYEKRVGISLSFLELKAKNLFIIYIITVLYILKSRKLLDVNI